MKAEFHFQTFKAAKERYFDQLGELIKSSGVDNKVKVEKRGSGAVIWIEDDRVHGSKHSEEDEDTHEDSFITHEREVFSGTQTSNSNTYRDRLKYFS